MDTVLLMLASERGRAVSVYRRLMASRDGNYEDAATYGSAVKGERTFAERALASVSEPPKMPSGWTPEGLAEFVARAEGFSLEHLRQAGKSLKASRVRLIAAYLGRRQAGFSVARMAKCFRREESTFNRGVNRLEALMTRDDSVRTRVANLSSRIVTRNTGIHD
jgi:chromosomal replication initiation ATPase DnaA